MGDKRGIQLVVSDIDGTLITSNHEVTEATRSTSANLRARSIGLSLASSRPPRSILPFVEALGLTTPFAAFNGALIVGADQRAVAREEIQPATIARVWGIAEDLGLDVWVYDELDWWVPQRNSFVDREQHTSGVEPLLDGYRRRLEDQAVKLTVVGNPALVGEAEGRVHETLGNEVAASRSKPRFLDITAGGIHKGEAVKRLSRLLGLVPEQVAVIGDGPNDLDMFREAGVSIAMGQAVDQVRAAADNITSSNDDEGWSRGIERFVLGAYDVRESYDNDS